MENASQRSSPWYRKKLELSAEVISTQQMNYSPSLIYRESSAWELIIIGRCGWWIVQKRSVVGMTLVDVYRRGVSWVKVDAEVLAWVGSNVTLRCSVETSGTNITQVTWQRIENGQNKNFLTYSNSKLLKLTPFAEQRVKFLGDGYKNGSIEIINVELSDERTYTCTFTLFPTGAADNTISFITQAKPDINIEPSPEPVVAKLPYQTVAICVARAAKPSANITWLTDKLDYISSESELQHANTTVTTQSQLKMIPRAEIKDRSVTCVISHGIGTSNARTERKLTIQNVQYPPDSVHVEVRRLDNGTFQFICVEDSSPPATNFKWRRKDTFDSNATVELGNEKTLSSEDLLSGIYFCEVTNPVGRSSGYLYVYQGPGCSACLHACLWPWLIVILALAVFCYWRYRKQPKEEKAANKTRDDDDEDDEQAMNYAED
ncbi:PREDICTED: nectin-1-like [Nanorana parkeri]|uniref:nectin-1-like n=1 Tax=Nanorana parkeri TaxID=125878 RepID=UPI00085498A9|nr:PREDICTED: nectin-1-like [Nanorana parkeri]